MPSYLGLHGGPQSPNKRPQDAHRPHALEKYTKQTRGQLFLGWFFKHGLSAKRVPHDAHYHYAVCEYVGAVGDGGWF